MIHNSRANAEATKIDGTSLTFVLSDRSYGGCPCGLNATSTLGSKPIGVAVHVLDEDGDPVTIGTWHDQVSARTAIANICAHDGVPSHMIIDHNAQTNADHVLQMDDRANADIHSIQLKEAA